MIDGTWGGTEEKQDRKRNHKGFTLVELIVVIVILAILAAILIPGLLKWIDEARLKKYELEARNIYQAAEAEATKLYAKGEKPARMRDDYLMGFSKDNYWGANYNDEVDDIIALSGVEDIEYVFIYYSNQDDWEVTGVTMAYRSSDGKKIYASIDSGEEWTIYDITNTEF